MSHSFNNYPYRTQRKNSMSINQLNMGVPEEQKEYFDQ